MMLKEFLIDRVYEGSLDKGVDLLSGLFDVMHQHGISAGTVQGIGSLSQARLAFYNQETRVYEEKNFPEPLEIVSLKGNISLKDHAVFPHLHAVLSRRDFSAIGGHVLPETRVFAFEFEIISFVGEPFSRRYDDATGLSLWRK
jgi:predicted DNA-binding protein with PD1-like motif